jgi:hypothetical protein
VVSFDTLDHAWLVKFIEHRIGDRRVVRHIRKWLNAGIFEDGQWRGQEEGTPQGGSVSPLLANLYRNSVFDLWAEQWRGRHARGDVIIVRYCDDFIVGFQHQDEAERFWVELRERFHRFNLELHPEKTRLIEFGRFAVERRKRRGEGKPETFDFLGFTHMCGKTRRYRGTVVCSVCFVRASSALGAVRCGGAANVIVSLGDGCTRLRSSGYRNPASCILTLHNACALLPEARARCGNSARRDLCGGCRVTGIPTATCTCPTRSAPHSLSTWAL